MTTRKSSLVEINMGSNYNTEDVEFMAAVDQYKRRNQRPFPAWSEILTILLSLGYRKVALKGPLPKYGEPYLTPEEKEQLALEHQTLLTDVKKLGLEAVEEMTVCES